jgi:Cu(I)/Ag(I) efflux system membrane fusion protein
MTEGQQPRSAGHETLPEGEEQAPPGTRTMAAVRWALVGLMALAAAGAWGYHLATRSSAAVVQGQKFICPMHPQIVADQKTECPICGMNLVPVGTTATAHAEPSAVPGLAPVELSAERIQLMGMRTAVATQAKLGTSLRAVGFVAATEDGLVSINTRYSGWVESVQVAQTGQLVQKGDVLLTLYSPELINAQTVFLNTIKWTDKRPAGAGAAPQATDLERDPRLRLELLGVAPQDVDAIIASGQPLRTMPVRAPSRGYLVRKSVLKGVFVAAGTEMFQLADLSTVWVLVDVSEADLPRVRLGQKATFASSSAPGKQLTGKVSFIYPALNTGSRTLQARVELPNPRLELRPGMFGDVQLETAADEAVVIPADALVDTGEHRYVFVDLGDGHFEPRPVRTGSSADGQVAVLEGLKAGERVVTKANFLLDSESRLRAAVAGQGK